MLFGVREICDVVLRAKSPQKIGDKIFYTDEPVLYFDTLKTSTLEGNSTTVYAQGGRGNSRLMAWQGERQITFTMEDALISPEGMAILTGAGVIRAASEEDQLKIHKTVRSNKVSKANVVYNETGNGGYYQSEDGKYYPAENKTAFYDEDHNPVSIFNMGSIEPLYLKATDGNYIEVSEFKYEPVVADGEVISIIIDDVNLTDAVDVCVFIVKNDNIISEPYIPESTEEVDGKTIITLKNSDDLDQFVEGTTVLVDYYVNKKDSNTFQIEITPECFGSNYYLEADTLFRDIDGVDMPARFILPNVQIQSNFSFSMSSSGDPSTFTFTLDAFPGYTKFDDTKKVICVIQMMDEYHGKEELVRDRTKSKQSI